MMDSIRATLVQLFPNRTPEVIDNVISIVDESTTEPSNVKLNMMIEILSHTNTGADQQKNDTYIKAICKLKLLDTEKKSTEDKHVNTFTILLEMFPDADTLYLSKKAAELADRPVHLQQFVEIALETNNYPKRVDPTKYLEKQCFVNPGPSTSGLGLTSKKRRIEDGGCTTNLYDNEVLCSFILNFIRNIENGEKKNELINAILGLLMKFNGQNEK